MRSRFVIFAVVLACRPSSSPTPPSPSPEPAPSAPPETTSPQPQPTADTPPPTNTAAPVDAKRELESAARRVVLGADRCIEIQQKKSQLYTPITIRLEIAGTGDVAKVVSVEHTPDRKPLADCYVAALKQHHFERTDGGGAIEIELKLPFGSMDKDIIRRVVRANLAQVRDCYNAGLARDATLKGRVTITFTISSTGAVSAAEIDGATEMRDAEVSRCIAAAAKTWKFPEPEGGGNVVVTYPFVLESG